jgi:hypothetical protein
VATGGIRAMLPLPRLMATADHLLFLWFQAGELILTLLTPLILLSPPTLLHRQPELARKSRCTASGFRVYEHFV